MSPAGPGAPDGHHRRDGAQAETGQAGPLEAGHKYPSVVAVAEVLSVPDHNLPWEYAWLPQNVAVHPRHESSIVEIEPFTVAVQADFDVHGTDRDRRSR